jgi:subtilisin
MKNKLSLLFLTSLLFGCSSNTKRDKVVEVISAKNYGRSIASVNQVPITKSKRRIVIFKSNVENPNGVANEMAKKFRVTKGHVFKYATKGFGISLPDVAVAELYKDSRIRYIINDKPIKMNVQVTPPGISRIAADKNATALIAGDGGNVDVDIAIIDTGIQLNHSDLNVFQSVNYAKGKSAKDGNGHGTHVSGTAAALDNGTHVVGVAPGARLWAVRVLDNRGSGYTSDIIKGIDYVTLHAAEIDVVNMSLGGVGVDDGNCGLTNNDPMHEAICNSVASGVVYVVAAGNETDNAANHTPAAYNEVITVSAFADTDGLGGGNGSDSSYGPDDTFATFSNFGEDVDIAAPGVDILSTWNDGGTNTISGTSMAAPHVAGLVALYIAKNGKPSDGAGVAAIRTAIVAIANDQNSAEGFSGDPDSFNEPTANAEAIDPMGPTTPAVKLALGTDQLTYSLLNGENTALISTTVKDEDGNAISGLLSTAFSNTLDGVSGAFTLQESGSIGAYETNLDLSSLTDGIHNVSVTVTDERSLTGSGSTNFTITSTALPTIHVASINYGLNGGRSGDKNLTVTVTAADGTGVVQADANISMDLYKDGAFIGSGSGVTGSNGSISFSLRNAKAGCYTTAVTSLSKTSFDRDQTSDAPDLGLCK